MPELTNEQLAEIEALIASRNPAIDDMDTLRVINDLRTASSDLIAELRRLRAELDDLNRLAEKAYALHNAPEAKDAGSRSGD